ncbi:TRAP transporter small permease [Chloroflexota bacterium]
MKKRNILSELARVTEHIERVIAGIAGVGIAMMAILTCYAVIVRNALGWNTAWVFESSELMMLPFSYLAAALILRLKGHTSIEFLTRYLNKSRDAILTMVTDLLGLIFAVLITWRGWEMFWKYRQLGSTTMAADIPIYPFMLVIPLGGLLLCWEFIINQATKLFGGRDYE